MCSTTPVTSMPHTAAVARSSCVSTPPTSATHSGTQPVPSRRSSSRSCPGGARAGAAASARHHQPPRPDRRTPPGCLDRGVLAGACVSIPGPVGAAPVRGRSRASAELRANRERLWPQRRRPRPPHGAPGRGERGCGARFASLNSPATAAAHSRPADQDPDRLERLTGTVAAPVQAACLAAFPWASFRRTKGAIKLHVGLDQAGHLPSFLSVTDGPRRRIHVGEASREAAGRPCTGCYRFSC